MLKQVLKLFLIMSLSMALTNAGKRDRSPVKTKEKPTQNEIDKLGQQKLEYMERLESYSTGNMIDISVADFKKYVMQNPRPYDVVAMFNVKQNCDHCAAVAQEYRQMIYSFVQERNLGGATRGQEIEKKIFFVVLYFAQDYEIQELYRSLEMTTVPFLAVSAMDMKRDSRPETFYKEEDRWLINQGEVSDAQKQIDFVNNHLRTDVHIKYTFQQIMIKNLIGLAIVTNLFALVKYFYNFLLNQWVWFTIAIIVYVVCTGGLIYGILNNMPWFKFEKNEYGSVVITEYFMRGQRGQWAGEGYIISVLCAAIGLIYLYLNKIQDITQDKGQMRMAVLISLASIFVLQQLLLMAYRIKSPWYNPSFWPPNYYTTGSLLQDQGNNI